MSPPSLSEADTFGGRLRQYKRREHMIVWVGAGLVALITVFASVEFTRGSSAPALVARLVPTLVLVGGASLALARVRFEWAATQLKRLIEDGKYRLEDQLPEEHRSWPCCAEFCWLIELYATMAARVGSTRPDLVGSAVI